MQIDVSTALLIAIGLITVVGSIWRIASIEKDIQISIRKIEAKLDIFATSYNEQKEHQQYLINDLYAQIKHKSDRLMTEIKEQEAEIRRLKQHD